MLNVKLNMWSFSEFNDILLKITNGISIWICIWLRLYTRFLYMCINAFQMKFNLYKILYFNMNICLTLTRRSSMCIFISIYMWWMFCISTCMCTYTCNPMGSVVQASGGIQPQPSRFGPDEISAVAAAARFTCQYGSRNDSRPLTVHIINVATTICTSSSCSCIICSSFPICCTGLPAT